MQGDASGMDLSWRNISASQVKKHEKCPMQWWFRYASDYEGTKIQREYMDLGIAVHETIEEVLAYDPPPDWDSWADWDIEDRLLSKYEERYKSDVPDFLKERGAEALEGAAKYLRRRSPRLIGVEDRIEFRIDRHDLKSDVTAILDVTVPGEIWDWKTGRIRDNTDKEETIQGLLYAAAYRDEYGESPEKIRFIYLVEGEIRSVTPTEERWNEMLAHAKELQKSKREGQFEATPGSQCYWCEYEFYCNEAPAGVGENFEWRKYMP